MASDSLHRVHDLLSAMPKDGLEAAKELFWTELNYARVNESLSTRNWSPARRELLDGEPILFARAGEPGIGQFDVIYCRLDEAQRGRGFPLSIGAERTLINRLLKNHPYGLYLFSNPQETHWHLVNVKDVAEEEEGRRTRQRVLRRIAVGPEERLRTAAERVAMLDVDSAEADLFGLDPLALQHRHNEAFDVEKVTDQFFADYRRLFEEMEAAVQGLDEGEDLRLFTQRLFNRLLFITFLERKGWLTLDGHADYLRALWADHKSAIDGEEAGDNFYRDRLQLLFFSGLNNAGSVDMMGINRGGFLQERIGRVPYLNGGLFERKALDECDEVTVPDAVFGPIFDDLIYHYNFTVTESTPLDIEVAVDPEMLGRIFEELVTGRHETGSYYTPKAVVSFMCREALKGYLRDVCPREEAGVLGAFVEQRQAADIRHPETVLAALQGARVCDPACGSGAYLVGMLHELVDLRQTLFATRRLDARSAYERKLQIIQRNLYGVDSDPFAVNIARLRLWLSLMVEFEGETPPPLPNLEFKIKVGDSLTGPAPGQLQPDLFRHRQVEQYFRLKGEFMTAHGPEKTDLRRRIEALQREIAEWASGGNGDGFDWTVQFAEVFAGPGWDTSTLTGAMTAMVNTTGGQMELAAQKGPLAGFDIVLTNPPYVRQELLGSDLKEVLEERYPQVYRGTADLYVYFYARALQLLREGGVGSFISSNKWLRSGYGEKLRRRMATGATVHAVVDFGDLPLFEATTYPMIIVFQNEPPDGDQPLRALEVEDLDMVDRLSEVVQEEGWRQPQDSLGAEIWSLVRPEVRSLLRKLRNRGIPLEQHVDGEFHVGIKTGLNKAYIIDEVTKNHLVDHDPSSEEVIEPWLRGRNVKRWKVDRHEEYLIAIQNSDDKDAENPWGNAETEEEARRIFRRTYPAVHDYLSQYEERLRNRSDQGKFWWELRACSYYGAFKGDKIIWPDIAKRCEFTIDESGAYPDMTLFVIPRDDEYLLGILNSSVTCWLMRLTSSTIQQGFLRFKRIYVGPIPIPTPTEAQRAAIEELVRKLLDAHRDDQVPQVPGTSKVPGTSTASSISRWERELNTLVYEVYGLTDDEIALVEEAVGDEG